MEPSLGADPSERLYRRRRPAVAEGMERTTGIEPASSWLEAKCPTDGASFAWSGRGITIPRPQRWQRRALPLSYYRMEAYPGVEPGLLGLQSST